MIIHDVIQGSQAWLDLHVGILTASKFHRLMTEKTRKPAKGEAIHRLACETAAEHMMGQLLDGGTSQFMARGTKLESRAAAWYAFEKGCEVQTVGFIMDDTGLAGCSPDGLVGDDGGVEIKCPSPANHVANLCDNEAFVDQYYAQCQGGMLICKRRWWDLVSWHPSIPSVVVRIERDPEYQTELWDAICRVVQVVDSILRTHGFKE